MGLDVKLFREQDGGIYQSY